MIKEDKIKEYLSKKFNGKVTDVKIEKLGSGVVGTGYAVNFKLNDKQEKKILKTLFTENLNLDHSSDRAKSLLLAHDNYNSMENHVKSVDVVGIKEDGSLISVGESKEFFILMDEAKGQDFFKDLESLNTKDSLDEKTRNKVINLTNFLIKLHKKKHNSESLYKRKIRDTIGSECLMGVLDIYPKETNWTTDKEISEMVKLCVDFWTKTKHMNHRLCEIHGDFHPGNIYISKGTPTKRILTPILFDYGMVGYLTDEIRNKVIDLIRSGIERNMEGALDALKSMAMRSEHADESDFDLRARMILINWYGSAIGEVSFVKTIYEIINLGASCGYAFDTSIILLAKVLFNLEGICISLYPGFNVESVLKDYLKSYSLNRFKPSRLVDSYVSLIRDHPDFFSDFPRHMFNILEKIEKGEKQI